MTARECETPLSSIGKYVWAGERRAMEGRIMRKSTAIRIVGVMVPLPVSKWELKAKLGLKNADDMTVTCRAKRILLLLLLGGGGTAQ